MGLKTFVKISDISNLSDARYCAGMGVDILGFRIDPEDPGRITPDKFKSITEWISGVKLAGEFQSSDPKKIRETAANYHLDYIQVNNWAYPIALKELRLPVILEVDIADGSSFEELKLRMEQNKKWVEFYLLSSHTDESCLKFLEKLEAAGVEIPALLGCGISEQNVANLIKQTSVKGIALKGSEEIKPGYKDYDELAGILESLETE